VPQVDAAGTSNSTNVRLTRQKAALFQWLAVPLWFPTEKIVCQQIWGIPFECFSIRRPASSAALGGLIHELADTLREANAVLDCLQRADAGQGPRGV